MPRELNPEGDGKGLRIFVATARFNEKISDGLLDGALGELETLGVGDDTITTAWVPGAFELPVVAKTAAQTSRYDAIICLGAVIEGDTDHYTYICEGVTHGLTQAALETEVPIGFGVLTVREYDHATKRSRKGEGNKGAEAARAAVQAAILLRTIRGN